MPVITNVPESLARGFTALERQKLQYPCLQGFCTLAYAHEFSSFITEAVPPTKIGTSLKNFSLEQRLLD